MANMSMTKNPIPEQEPLVRNKNFDEVALGYTEEIAIDEAQALPQLPSASLRQRLPGERPHSGVHRQGRRG